MQLWLAFHRHDLNGWFVLFSVVLMASSQGGLASRQTSMEPQLLLQLRKKQSSNLLDSPSLLQYENLEQTMAISRTSTMLSNHNVLKPKLKLPRSILAIKFFSLWINDYDYLKLFKKYFIYERYNSWWNPEMHKRYRNRGINPDERLIYNSTNIFRKKYTKIKRNSFKKIPCLKHYDYIPNRQIKKSNGSHTGKSCIPIIKVDKIKIPVKNRPELSLCSDLVLTTPQCQKSTDLQIITPYPMCKETTKGKMKLNFELDYDHAGENKVIFPTLGVNMLVQYSEEPNTSHYPKERTYLLIALIILVIVTLALLTFILLMRKNKSSICENQNPSDYSTMSHNNYETETLYVQKSPKIKGEFEKRQNNMNYVILSSLDEPLEVLRRVPVIKNESRKRILKGTKRSYSNISKLNDGTRYYRKSSKPIYRILTVDDEDLSEEKDSEESDDEYSPKEQSRDRIMFKRRKESANPYHASDTYLPQASHKNVLKKSQGSETRKPSQYSLKRIKLARSPFEENLKSSPTSSHAHPGRKQNGFFQEKIQVKNVSRSKSPSTEQPLLYLDESGEVYKISSENVITTHHRKKLKSKWKNEVESEQDVSTQSIEIE